MIGTEGLQEKELAAERISRRSARSRTIVGFCGVLGSSVAPGRTDHLRSQTLFYTAFIFETCIHLVGKIAAGNALWHFGKEREPSLCPGRYGGTALATAPYGDSCCPRALWIKPFSREL